MAGNKKISELSASGTLDGTELVEIVQSAGNVRTTTQAIANLGGGGGGFTAVSPVGNLLRVATVGSGDVVLTAEASHISESEFSMQAIIEGAGSQIILGTSDTDTGDTSSFQSNPEAAVLVQTNGVYYAGITAGLGELYMESISVPTATAGVIGIGTDGKLFTTSQGLISVVGGTDISIDNTDPLNPIINYTGAGGGVTSVSGTANRISSTGGATPVIDIDAAYVGQTSITTIGTITTGTVPASHVSAGTFGTGAYTMDTSLRVGPASGTGVLFRNDTGTYTAFYNGSIGTPSTANYFLKNNGITTLINASTGGSLYLAYNGSFVINITSGTAFGIADAVNITTGTTTGTKLMTSTTQKFGIWNATPIVQPTTAVAAATFVTNTSLIANDSATFDGYTMGQVVKALRNIGLLA